MLFDICIDDKQNWKEQVSGPNGLINALNHRTFTIRRLRNQIPKKEVIKVVNSLWMSKLRYGLQFCSQVRTKRDDPTNQNMKAIQVAQNKMLRMVEGISLKEHVTADSLLQKYKLPSANQLAGQIKLTEAWKSINIKNYPFKMEANNMLPNQTDRILRPGSIKLWNDNAKTKMGTESFSIDTAKLWNNCPVEIKTAKSLGIAKKSIKHYCASFEL